MSKQSSVALLPILVLVFLTFVPECGNAQASFSPDHYIWIEGGRSAFSMPYLKQSLDETVTGMSAVYNLHIQKLTRFPNNWFLGGAYTRRITPRARLDVAGWYTYTKGAIGYRDLNGRLREDIRLNIEYFRVGVLFDIFNFGGVPGYFAIHGGLLTTGLDIHDTIEFYEEREYNATARTANRSYFIAADMAIGAHTHVFGTEVVFECGYRVNRENRSADFSDSFNGWMVSSRVGLPLPL